MGHVMGNEILPYWHRVHDRALRDTLRAAVVAIAGAVALWCLTCIAVAGPSLETKMVTACAILIMFPAVYLWKLITTPARLDAEARKERDALRQELDGRHKEIPLALGKLMDEGETLAVAIERSSMFGKPLEYMNWCEKVEAYLRELDDDLVSRFRVGSGFPGDIPSEMFVANASQYLGVKGRVGRLNQFIEEYSAAVSTASVQPQRPQPPRQLRDVCGDPLHVVLGEKPTGHRWPRSVQNDRPSLG
jgi:hypothetical protein